MAKLASKKLICEIKTNQSILKLARQIFIIANQYKFIETVLLLPRAEILRLILFVPTLIYNDIFYKQSNLSLGFDTFKRTLRITYSDVGC